MDMIDLTRNAKGQLVLTRPGHDDVVDVRVRRAFPLTHGERYISLRGPDGKEILLLEDLTAVPSAARAVIVAALSANTFVPRIGRVESVDVRFGYQQWTAQTDRGPAGFRVQEREDIRFLPDGSFRIKDADGTVYELGAIDQLDEVSRRAVEPLL